jgi:uncharacterized protein (TIGR02145 family)
LTIVLFITSGLLASLSAQAPEGFTYQAIARDASGKLLANKSLTVRISILLGLPGSMKWEADYSVSTDVYGMFTIIIGELGSGTVNPNSVDFSEIDWGQGTYYLNVKILYKSNWLDMGTTQLLSVPYALYAKSAGSADNETDPVYSGWDKSYKDLSDLPDLTIYATKDMASQHIINLADPVNAKDAATKDYVDALKSQVQELQAEVGVKDIEGNAYKAVKIGDQVWMAENLKTKKFNDGIDIQNVTVNTDWGVLTTGAFCWYNNDAASYQNLYGALYNWHAVNTGKLCPQGWHVPSNAEWTTLTTFLGGESVAGGKLKEAGTAHWTTPNTGATNESGFSGLPGGARYYDGSFGGTGEIGFWWSYTEYSTIGAWGLGLLFEDANVNNGYDFKGNGGCVRCVRDN